MYTAQQEEWTYQANIKFGPNDSDMLNVRATSAADLAGKCSEMEAFVQDVVSLSRTMRNPEATVSPEQALANVQAQFPQTQQIQPGVITPQPQQPQAYGPPPPAPQCPHGIMKFMEGISKTNNRPYKAYFCPAPKGPGQCAPQFLN